MLLRLGLLINVDASPLRVEVASVELFVVVDRSCGLEGEFVRVVEYDEAVQFSWARGSDSFMVWEMRKHVIESIDFLFREADQCLSSTLTVDGTYLQTDNVPVVCG